MNVCWKCLCLCLMLLFPMLLVPMVCFGQVGAGRVSTTVVDDSGAVVPGATVTLENITTGLQRRVVTDEKGIGVFDALPP